MNLRSCLSATVAGLVLGLAAHAAPPPPPPTTQPGGEEKVFTWPEVVQLSLEKGRLTMTTPLPMIVTIPWPTIKIEGVTGTATVRHRPTVFEVTVKPENAAGGQAAPSLRLEARSGECNLESRHEFGDMQVIDVIVAQANEGQKYLQLPEGWAKMGYYKGKIADAGKMQMLKAPTFLRLRLENPQAIDEFLRPVLESTRCAQVLVPPDLIAQQVLVDPKPADALAGAVTKLVKALDTDDGTVRDKAVADLLVLGAGTLESLKGLDQSKLTDAQKKAVESLLASPDLLPTPIIEKLRKNVNFLLDCLLSDDHAIRGMAAKLLAKATDKKFEWDDKVKSDERPAAVAKLREQLAPPAKLEPAKVEK